MKKYLFVLFALLLAGSAYADEMQQTPQPEIFWEVNDNSVIIYAVGEGEVLMYDYFGNLVSNPFEVARLMYYEGDGEMTVMATAQIEGWLISEPVYATVPIPALEKPFVPEPTFECVYDDAGVWVYAVAEDPEIDDVSLYLADVGGESIANPYFLEKQDEEYYAFFQAMTIRYGLYDSDWAFYTVLVPALEQPPLPMEKTAAPSMALEFGGDDYSNIAIVTIVPTEEDCDIYWRYGFDSWGGGFEWSEWMQYEDVLVFTEEGNYVVEAYAVAPDKLESEFVSIAFTLTPPTPPGPHNDYDFEVDGIFYKITDSGKVAVTAHGDYLIGYHGDIVIPNMVTNPYGGATYMVTSIEGGAFNSGYDDITSVEIGDYVTTIGNGAFRNCGLTKVTLGDYVISIGDGAFEGCSGLTSLTIGSGVRNIGAKAFAGCSALTSVICKPAVPPVMANSNCFDCYDTAMLHVFPAVLDSYQATNYWNQFTNIVGEDNVVPDPGDANGDGNFNISDIIQLINRLTAAP
jgi:hypothetical protein